MQLQGAFEVARKPEEVRSFLADLNRVAPCLPDLQEAAIDSPGEGTVKVKAGVGFVKGIMSIRLRAEEEDGSVHFRGQGNGMGSAVDIDARFDVEPAGEGSRVGWRGEARISGTLASLGGGLLDPVARKQVEELMRRIEAALQG